MNIITLEEPKMVILSKPLSEGLKQFILDWFPTIDFDKCFVAGGFLCSYFSDEKPKDMDIFFEDLSMVEEFGKRLQALGYNKIRKSVFSVTWGKGEMCQAGLVYRTIQLCINIHGDYNTILSNFDFTVCQALVKGDTLMYSPEFFEDIEKRRLVLTPAAESRCATTLERIIRYASYGFKPPRKEMHKIIHLIHEADPKDLKFNYKKPVQEA